MRTFIESPIKIPTRSSRDGTEGNKDANTQHSIAEKCISPLSAPKKKRRQPGIQYVGNMRDSSRLDGAVPESKSQNQANTFQVQSWADSGFEEWDTPGQDTTNEDEHESLG